MKHDFTPQNESERDIARSTEKLCVEICKIEFERKVEPKMKETEFVKSMGTNIIAGMGVYDVTRLAELIERHELIRSRLKETGFALLHDAKRKRRYFLRYMGNAIIADWQLTFSEMPTDADAIIIEGNFAHTGNALELTRGLPDASKLIKGNVDKLPKADRCGCCACGSIFETKPDIKSVFESTYSTSGDDEPEDIICPICGKAAIVVEENDGKRQVTVNDNSLWRYHKNLYAPIWRSKPEEEKPQTKPATDDDIRIFVIDHLDQFGSLENCSESTSYLSKKIDRHELIREMLEAHERVVVYHSETREKYTLRSEADMTFRIEKYQQDADEPTDENAIITEDSHCHTGDAWQKTKHLVRPDDLMQYNFYTAQHSERCGCINCGEIFPGSKADSFSAIPMPTRNPKERTALCPVCGMDTVLCHGGGIEINANNLWRWYKHFFDGKKLGTDR